MVKKAKTKSVKFTQEELNTLQAVRNDYANIQNEFGNLRVRKLRLEQEVNLIDAREVELEGLYLQVQQNEQKTSADLQDKYGSGNLDFETGEFTPEN
jgi:hypothetical protein